MERATHPLVPRWRRLAARASSLDAAPPGSVGATVAAALVGGWAAARVLVTAPLSPVLALAVFGAAWRNTVRTAHLIERFPCTVERVMRGDTPEQPDLPGARLRVGRRPSAGCYVITSDLHRCIAGGLDWPGGQQTKALYAAVLRHYAADDWVLVENGDVEDFWLTGGSAYGVAYDVARLAANLLPRRHRQAVLPEIYGDHVDRIAANNTEVGDVIREGFGADRYVRLVGNHDDPYLDERVVDRLRHHHPDVPVVDVLVLDGPEEPVGVVLHGHQTDAWNLPGRDFLGKYCTWLATALIDSPLLRATPGIPDVEESARLHEGRTTDRLMRVGRRFGVNRDLYSLDEVLLLDSWRRWFGGGPGPGTDAGPILVMGHTHVPLIDPLAERAPVEAVAAGGVDDAALTWQGYANSGCGVLWETVTAVEWDGTLDPANPVLRLVVWRYGAPTDDAGAAVAEIDGRPVVREEYVRPHGSSTLQPVRQVAP